MEGVRADPQTYDWGGGEWSLETSGKEDNMFSPFLKKPFEQAIEAGMIPARLNTIAGTWGAMHETGELTYMNLIHLDCDGTIQSLTALRSKDDVRPCWPSTRCGALRPAAKMRGLETSV